MLILVTVLVLIGIASVIYGVVILEESQYAVTSVRPSFDEQSEEYHQWVAGNQQLRDRMFNRAVLLLVIGMMLVLSGLSLPLSFLYW